MVSRSGRGPGNTMAMHNTQAKTWVRQHYERHPEGVVAKAVMYKHYEDFCRSNGRNIMETSIFGRVVKSVFPDVTIRRLGGRDNLKYYYCGIQAKETSPHAVDNATTTRPKRRLRKREAPIDKSDVHRCLLWLHQNYTEATDGSTLRSDVYDRYVVECVGAASEHLSMQHFAMVLSHAFPPSARRRPQLPRNSHQKFYFGLQERDAPLPLDSIPPDLHGAVEVMFSNGKLSYREEPDDDDDDDDDDESCRSPVSDTSEGSLRDTRTPIEPEALPVHHHQSYMHHHPYMMKEEPVDYPTRLIEAIRIKDEPSEDEYMVKDEPLDLHVPRQSMEHEHNSPPPQPKARKIYKPRFHWDEEEEDEEEEERYEPSGGSTLGGLEWEDDMRHFLMGTLRLSPGTCVNRDHLYAVYEQHCVRNGYTVMPMSEVDQVVLTNFPGVNTEIRPPQATFYRGVRVAQESPLCGHIEEIHPPGALHHRLQPDPALQSFMAMDHSPHHHQYHQQSMELSPPRAAAPRVSPHSLHDEEEEGSDERWGEDFQAGVGVELVGPGGPGGQDDHSTPEVLRDGKYYLRMWLTDNFESVPDSCVLKADAYRHYELYARSIKQTPFEMNVFGKIVRQVFPKVSIRRLGGRVKPQYHYCGIAVKTTSPLFQYMSGKDPAQRSRKKEIATDNRSAEVVIEWLRGTYLFGREGILLKSAVFNDYCAYCQNVNETPVTLNYFGKLVKHCFPNVEVRKCGGRSEPTWYYFGLIPRGPRPPATSPVPICVGGGSPAHHYGSPSMLQAVLGQGAGLGQSPLMNRRSPFPASPGEAGLEAYSDPLASHCPGEELRRRVLAPSPYEPTTPTDTLYSRSPGDTSAQFCRSPGDNRYCRSPADVSGYCRSPGDLGYCRSPHLLEADPTNLLDGEGIGRHSPADSLMYSHSPGALALAQHQAHKRLKGQALPHPGVHLGPQPPLDNYHTFPNVTLE